MLTNSNGVAWNASLDLSLSPNPNTIPDSDVVLSGELVVCSLFVYQHIAVKRSGSDFL
jgi:hypothetical protein